MSKMSSPNGPEKREKRVTSISLEPDFSTQEVRKEDKFESAKAEMGEVKEENERLKMMLERVEKDYHTLKLRFFDIVNKEASKKGVVDYSSNNSHDDETEEPELVSLSLGRSPMKEERIENCKKHKEKELLDVADEANLSLGLDTKNFLSMEIVSDLSPTNSSEEPIKEAEAKSTNKSSAAKVVNVNDDISDQVPAKRARVSVRARCDTPTMNDGCQWRKYGQKIAKGNPCPRAYYRCTVAPSCPVRKQVQRCADDLSILITTYEGTHNHPLPVTATAMASTTSAAASMLLSGSSSTSHNPPPHTSFANSPSLLNSLSFSQHFDESRAKHVFLPPNHASSQHLFPTITLDLTSPSPSSNIASNTRFSPTSLNFCSPESNFMSSSIWGNKGHIRQVIPGNNFQFQEQFYQQCMSMANHQTPSRENLAETITKAISTDPSLRSVIAAAVSSIVGQGSNQEGARGEILGEGLNLKLGENPQFGSSNMLNQNGKGCLNGYFKRLSSTSSQSGNVMLLQPTLPFSLSKSSSTSTAPPSLVNNQINHFVLPEMNTHH